MNVEKVKEAVAKRDAAMAKAQADHAENVRRLSDEFNVEQRALAEKYAAADSASLMAANKLFNDAVEAFDAELRDLEKADMEVVVGSSKKTFTAKQVADKMSSVDIKAQASKLGLKTDGSEVAVAQRLLDAGWVPSF